MFGEVEDHWFRFEEQGRGSLHLHLLLWLKKVPLEEGEDTQRTTGTQDSFADERADLQQRCAVCRVVLGGLVGLGWLGWVGLVWFGLGWVGLGWVGVCWVGLGLVGLG